MSGAESWTTRQSQLQSRSASVTAHQVRQRSVFPVQSHGGEIRDFSAVRMPLFCRMPSSAIFTASILCQVSGSRYAVFGSEPLVPGAPARKPHALPKAGRLLSCAPTKDSTKTSLPAF